MCLNVLCARRTAMKLTGPKSIACFFLQLEAPSRLKCFHFLALIRILFLIPMLDNFCHICENLFSPRLPLPKKPWQSLAAGSKKSHEWWDWLADWLPDWWPATSFSAVSYIPIDIEIWRAPMMQDDLSGKIVSAVFHEKNYFYHENLFSILAHELANPAAYHMYACAKLYWVASAWDIPIGRYHVHAIRAAAFQHRSSVFLLAYTIIQHALLCPLLILASTHLKT